MRRDAKGHAEVALLATPASSPPSLSHEALLYSSDDEYVAGVRAFAREGLDAGGSLLVAVPGPRLPLLRSALGELEGRVLFADLAQTGLNPGRIIPFIRAFLDANPGRRALLVSEPIWAGRTEAEIAECVRHEGLINEAFAGAQARILCAYDTGALAPGVLADAARTHPTLREDGDCRPSLDYADPLVTYAAADRPLREPPAVPLEVSVAGGLGGFRSLVRAQARSAGIDPDRAASFVVAANEAAANTLVHAGGDGWARIWRDEHELVCELSDAGVIADPLVGRRLPPPDREGGRGIWLMHQLSDLVELRSGEQGTIVRIHMRL
jgi:anti-sigma regulatory factor (Ser/Thr protein kinase)